MHRINALVRRPAHLLADTAAPYPAHIGDVAVFVAAAAGAARRGFFWSCHGAFASVACARRPVDAWSRL